MERHLRDRRGGRSRGIENARCHARAAETRAGWVGGAVTEWRRQQVVKMPAFRRKGRLCRIDERLERALLVERVDEFHRRYAVLRFDDAPADARPPAALRRERGGRPGTRFHAPAPAPTGSRPAVGPRAPRWGSRATRARRRR